MSNAPQPTFTALTLERDRLLVQLHKAQADLKWVVDDRDRWRSAWGLLMWECGKYQRRLRSLAREFANTPSTGGTDAYQDHLIKLLLELAEQSIASATVTLAKVDEQ